MADTTRKKRRVAKVGREFDPSRWAHLIFVLGGFVAAWVLTHMIESVWALLWDSFPKIGRPNTLTANTIGILVAIAGTVIAWRRAQWFKFATEVVVEIAQVTWPTRAEIRAATIVVIVMTLICSVLLFAMDQIWSNMTDLLYGI